MKANFRKATLKVTSIKPYKNNPRIANKRAVAAVRKSIEEYGYNVPIVVDTSKVVLAGHTRLLAIKEMGWEKVTVLVAKDLTKKEADSFRVIDNRVAELTEWDDELLRNEIRAVGGEEFEAFFTSDELDNMLKKLDESEDANNPSQSEIDKQAESNDEKFEKKAAEQSANLITLTCKCCDEEFSIDRRVILNPR